MKIKIYLIGKIREKFFKDGIEEYKKRLFNNVEVVECTESKILSVLDKNTSFNVALAIEGKMLSSQEFAELIKDAEQDGRYQEISYFIGDSNGLSEEIKNRSNIKLSFSKMTFTHQHAVFVLIEQIYRAHRILNNEPYHK